MNKTITFDPGKRSAAWAVFDGPVLVRCGMERWGDNVFPLSLEELFRASRTWEPMRVLIEYQQIYAHGRARTRNAADILSVTLTAGRIAQAIGPHAGAPRFVLPHEWKGSVRADVMLGRIVAILSSSERDILHATQVPRTLLHNVVDAIGLGLWSVGRLGRNAKRENGSSDSINEGR